MAILVIPMSSGSFFFDFAGRWSGCFGVIVEYIGIPLGSRIGRDLRAAMPLWTLVKAAQRLSDCNHLASSLPYK